VSSDLTFITNEPGKHLRDRFGVLLGENTRSCDCLVGYFFISGFHKLHPAAREDRKDSHSQRCYGFAYRDDETLQYATIAETDEVNSPKMAVKAFIASRIPR
jgi:hypothetical protein